MSFITRSAAHDNVYFRELFFETVKHFNVRKLTANMAYTSHANYELARDWRVDFYAPFKSNTAAWVDDGTAWSQALWKFNNRHVEFMEDHHQRSNAESTMSAIKRKFPCQLRAEGFIGQCNEVLCKVLAYNLAAVAREVRMRGVVPDYSSEVERLERAVAASCS